jgi:hypothetical protein
MAGGTDSPVGLSIPKELIPVAGRPIMARSLDLLQALPHAGGTVSMMTPACGFAAGALLPPGGTIPAPADRSRPRPPVRVSSFGAEPARVPAV